MALCHHGKERPCAICDPAPRATNPAAEDQGPKKVLSFKITKVDGSVETQDVTVPANTVLPAINQMLSQYSSVGILRKIGGAFRLTCPSQLAFIDVEFPVITLATAAEEAVVSTGKISLT